MMTRPPVGARVEVTGVMPDDPDPIPVGTQGTVTGGSDPQGYLPGQIWVDWDNGRTLILLTTDPYRVVTR